MQDRMIRTINGDEVDALSRRSKKVHNWAAGTRRGIKKNYRRRSRHTAKMAARIEAMEVM